MASYKVSRWTRPFTLDELARIEGTDKSYTHGYTASPYPLFLEQIRYLPVNFLEIGVRGGQSIKMWDRFFLNPASKLFCLDIDPKCAANVPSRWKFFAADQANLPELGLPKLDVVVDDGDHATASNIAAFVSLWPKLIRGGIYIIEDLDGDRLKEVPIQLVNQYSRKFSEFHLYGECLVLRKEHD